MDADVYAAELPGILAEIARVAGPVSALRVARAKGGQRVYMLKEESLTPDHWLVEAVGMDKARAIARAFGRGHIDIPLGPSGTMAEARAKIARALASGLEGGQSANQLARQVGVSRRTVFRHKSGETGGEPRNDQHTLLEMP
jgi:hypothetical protein